MSFNDWLRSSTNSNFPYPRLMLMSAVAVFSACADNPTTAPVAALRSRTSQSFGSGPTVFSNALKYRDAGSKPARGRSGAAVLTTRALLGRDGMTTLDVSTGNLEGGPTSGSLSKVQVKQFGPDGLVQSTNNYNSVGGPQSQYFLTGRIRNSKVQVQANVSGVDRTRTDVVTVMDIVKLSPDLSVDALSAPTRAPVNTPFQISAVLSENNGDVGARANCILAIDGVTADQAEGIWIDAGRTVSCVFTQSFATSGSRLLRVSLTNVTPADYDLSNNSASATVSIVPRNDFYWAGSVYSLSDYHGTGQYERRYTYPGGQQESWADSYTIDKDDQRWASINGGAQTGVGEITAVTFNANLGGTPIVSVTFDPATGRNWSASGSWNDPTYGTVNYSVGCTYSTQVAPRTVNGTTFSAVIASLELCSYSYSGINVPPSWSNSWFDYDENAGDVSYYGSGFYQFTDGAGGSRGYSWNGPQTSSWGNIASGTAYNFRLTLEGPSGIRQATGTIPLTTQRINFAQPYSCSDYNYGWAIYHACDGGTGSYLYTSGYAYGVPSQ